MNRWTIAAVATAAAVILNTLLGSWSLVTLSILLTAWTVSAIAHRTLAPVTVRERAAGRERRRVPIR